MFVDLGILWNLAIGDVGDLCVTVCGDEWDGVMGLMG